MKLCVYCAAFVALGLIWAPNNATPQIFDLEVLHTNLNAETFAVTLRMTTQPGRSYWLESADGFYASHSNFGDWAVASGIIVAPSTNLDVVDLLDPLPSSGRTYRAWVTLSGKSSRSTKPITSVVSRSLAYIAYPHMSNPTVWVNSSITTGEQVIIGYGEGLYSNTLSYAATSDVRVGFFRLFSPDNDPSNALIQIQHPAAPSMWETVPGE